MNHLVYTLILYRYEGCPESIGPFWISRELVAWLWCNLAASQRRPYCASVNSHPPVGLVSRQWDAIDWGCVLCDRHIHSDWANRSDNAPAHSTALEQVFFLGVGVGAKHHITLLQPRFVSLQLLAFPKAKIAVGKGGDLWMRRSHSTQAQSVASHCQLTSPTGEWLFTDVQ